MSAVPLSDGPNDSLEMTEWVTPSEDVHRSEIEDVENQINGGSEVEERSSLLGACDEGGTVEQENLAEMEILSILWTRKEGNEKYRLALERWEAKDALLLSRMERARKGSYSVRSEIYQLIGFYLVFQGVILTTVAQSSLLTCHNWWTAFFLSLLASMVTIGGVIQKFKSCIAIEKTINSLGFNRMLIIKRINGLLQRRENFRFHQHARYGPYIPVRREIRVLAIVVTSILLVFSALFLASVRQILCDSGLPAPPPAPNSGYQVIQC